VAGYRGFTGSFSEAGKRMMLIEFVGRDGWVMYLMGRRLEVGTIIETTRLVAEHLLKTGDFKELQVAFQKQERE
jgi:hypothetical protein